MEIQGKIIAVLPEKSGTSARGGWKSQQYVLETEEQYLLLKRLGCDLVQGFYFSKPVPEAEFEHFLLERAQS